MSFIENHGQLRQREPRVRDKVHLGRVARLPCIACLVQRGAVVRPVEVAHIKIGYPGIPGWRAFGHSERAHDWRTAPLCVAHHREGPLAQHGNHGGDEREFWARLGVWPPALCEALVKAFGTGSDGMAVIRQFAAAALEQRKGRCPR